MKIKKAFSFLPILLVAVAIVAGILFGGFNFSTEFTGGKLITCDLAGADYDAVKPALQSDSSFKGEIITRYSMDIGRFFISVQNTDLSDEEIADKVSSLTGASVQSVVDTSGTSGFIVFLAPILTIAGLTVIMSIYTGLRFKAGSGICSAAGTVQDIFLTVSFVILFRVRVSVLSSVALVAAALYSLVSYMFLFKPMKDNSESVITDNTDPMVFFKSSYMLKRLLMTGVITFAAFAAVFIVSAEVGMSLLPFGINVICNLFTAAVTVPTLWSFMAGKNGIKVKGGKVIG